MLTHLEKIKAQYLGLVLEIQRTGEHEFADYLPEQPDFIEKVIKNIRFGIFSKKTERPALLEKTYATLPYSEKKSDDYSRYSDQIQINFAQIVSLEQEIKDYLELPGSLFFDPKLLQAVKSDFVEVAFERYDYDCSRSNVCDMAEHKNTRPYALNTDFFNHWEVVAMAPGIDVLFEQTPEGYRFEDSDLIDAYETWLYARRSKEAYVQIGGHGMFIQHHFSQTYLGQINNDIGDCGSVFLCYEPGKGEYTSQVDMY